MIRNRYNQIPYPALKTIEKVSRDRNIEKWLQTTPEDWNNKSIKWMYGETESFNVQFVCLCQSSYANRKTQWLQLHFRGQGLHNIIFGLDVKIRCYCSFWCHTRCVSTLRLISYIKVMPSCVVPPRTTLYDKRQKKQGIYHLLQKV